MLSLLRQENDRLWRSLVLIHRVLEILQMSTSSSPYQQPISNMPRGYFLSSFVGLVIVFPGNG